MKFVCLLLLITDVLAFAKTGHYLIGSATQGLLNANVSQAIDQCGFLSDFSNDLGAASLWADSIKSIPAYRWTARQHYGNPGTSDNPPDSCLSYNLPINITKPSDIHTSLFRYNAKIHSMESKGSCDYRFSFLMYVHLLQDLFQPLHHCPKDRGGNEAERTYNGKKTNLHKMWDLDIVSTFIHDKFDGNITNATDYYVQRLQGKPCDVSFKDVHQNSTKWVDVLNSVHDYNCLFIWDEQIDDIYKLRSVTVLDSLFEQSIYTSSCLLNSLYTK